MAAPTTRTFSWREIVEKADGETRHIENLYPVVYEFGDRRFRDSGPASGVYEGA